MATFSKGPESIVSIGEKVGSLKDQRHAIIAARASDELRDILSLAIFHTSEK
jgi:hypothetical protein